MKQPLHILLLESDPAQCSAFHAAIESRQLPYSIFHAGSIAEARRLLLLQDVQVVVSELQAPDGSVFELLEGGPSTPDPAAGATSAPANHGPLFLPLILATSHGNEQVAANALKAGVFDYIIKDPEGAWLRSIPDSVERAVRQHQAQGQFHMLTHALMSITDAVFITDTAQTIVFVNKAFCKTYGYSESEVLGRHVSVLGAELATTSAASPAADDASRLREAQQAHPAEKSSGDEPGKPAARELYHKRKDGQVFPVSLSRSVMYDEKGLNMAIVGVARDISEWKEAEHRLTSSLKEKEVLLKEIHHRVKNNLQVVSSLLNLQSGFVKDEQTIDALRDSQNRVKSMALIHERLYQSESLDKIDFGGYVRSLVNHVKSSFHGLGEIDVEVDVTDMFVDVDVAIPCGLIINELASNSFKHAFDGAFAMSGQRQVLIRLSKQTSMAGQAELLLQVRDNGKGFPPGLDMENVASLGLQLVHSLVQQLQGAIALHSERGASSDVTIPLDKVA